jgi:hypothetical protein
MSNEEMRKIADDAIAFFIKQIPLSKKIEDVYEFRGQLCAFVNLKIITNEEFYIHEKYIRNYIEIYKDNQR